MAEPATSPTNAMTTPSRSAALASRFRDAPTARWMSISVRRCVARVTAKSTSVQKDAIRAPLARTTFIPLNVVMPRA